MRNAKKEKFAGFVGVFIGLLVFLLIGESTYALEFPLREKYSDVPTIETASLKKTYDDSIIVDVRSVLEFDVIHMDGAKHIPLAELSKTNLNSLRKIYGDKPIVFYCNGITCSKSYKATRKVMKLGVKNVFSYDAGIENWAKAVPDKTYILGRKQNERTINVTLIPKNKFQAVSVSPKEFIQKSKTGLYHVIDIREDKQRKAAPIELRQTQQMPLAELLMNLEMGGDFPTKNILVLDNVGKQVRWLQYYLNKYRIKNYFFLKGGVRKWQEDGYNSQGEKSSS